MSTRDSLRKTFDEAADLYLLARPQYPDTLFEQLAKDAALKPGARLLEVGSGPGVATKPLAQRGYRIDCVEPGGSLAAAARQYLSGEEDVRVIQTDFETTTLPHAHYDLVYAATAWHWIDPATRYRKAHQLLKRHGFLALWEASHVFPEGGDPLFADIQAVYDEIGEGVPPGTEWPLPGALPTREAEIAASGLFETISVRQFDWELQYSADGYTNLLNTFSGHIAMADWKRARLFQAIRDYVADRGGAPIRRHWGCVLHIAQKV